MGSTTTGTRRGPGREKTGRPRCPPWRHLLNWRPRASFREVHRPTSGAVTIVTSAKSASEGLNIELMQLLQLMTGRAMNDGRGSERGLYTS